MCFNFFLKNLRVEASQAYHSIFLDPNVYSHFVHVPYLVSGFEDHGKFLVSYSECTDLSSNLSQRLSGLNLFIILYIMTSRSNVITLLTFSQSQN